MIKLQCKTKAICKMGVTNITVGDKNDSFFDKINNDVIVDATPVQSF